MNTIYSKISKPFNVAIKGDCNAVMNSFPDNYFDLAVCDPPYGINVGEMSYLKEVNTYVKQKNGSRLNPNRQGKKYTIKDWDKVAPDQGYFDELKRISRHQIIFGINYMDWEGVGKGRLKWDKGVPEGVSFSRYEYAYLSQENKVIPFQLLWAGMQQAKSLKEPMRQQGNKKLNEKRIHPCHKPILLYIKLFLDYGFKDMKVIDTHLGSGSSRIAADKFGCSFLGIEIDEEYFSLHNKRWRNYKSQMTLGFEKELLKE